MVTDHRMAFAISKERTILWDQIRYQGNPTEFVWALPVKPGTVVELSSNRWISALDVLTDPVITAPQRAFSGGNFGNGGGGCGSAGCSSSETTADSFSGAVPASKDAGGVQVVNEQVVGPYETVTLRSTNPTALEDWLTAHGYEIQPSIRPIITAYVKGGFDFIALRLQPGQGVNAMQPVRVITPGADFNLPLRMVAAGVGQNVAITLFVISEGRYHTQNFPDAVLDFTKLTWDFSIERSNYQELSLAAMAANGGRSFLTEFANPVDVLYYPPGYPQSQGGLASLGNAYYGACEGTPPGTDVSSNMNGSDASTSDAGPVSCTTTTDIDAGTDAGAPDGAADDGAVPDEAAAPDAAPADAAVASCDAGSSDPPPPVDPNSCANLDDLVVAVEGMDPNSIWVTRLRANLPLAALAQDLTLEATQQTPVSNNHLAADPQNPNPSASSIAPAKDSGAGSLALGLGTAALVAVRLRRRRSRTRH